jgi:hypothetical protein
MTLAIGMECRGGIILAADTRASYADGSVAEIRKVTHLTTTTGMFAIAQSSEDANAASSLVRILEYALQNQPNISTVTLESLIEEQMRSWYAPIYDNRPTVQLLIGACLSSDGERRLYFCEPPSTIVQVSGGYKAIGQGFTVSDPIHAYWLRQGPALLGHSPHSCLCQISYLIHKAKQQLPGWVGGNTDAILITEKSNFPYIIERQSMASAEGHGSMFDISVSKFASIVMSGNSGGTETILKIAENIYQSSLNYSRLEFRCLLPSTDTVITHEFCT